MEFVKMDQFDSDSVQEIFASYNLTFPMDERRTEETFRSFFDNKNVSVLSIKNDETEIGYLIVWHLFECAFIEHFEVFEPYRNHGFGSKILDKLKEDHPKSVLEADPDYLGDIMKRRIEFYGRNGYKIIKKNYIQPSLGEGKNPVNLFLLSNFKPNDMEDLVNEIYQIVYNK